MAQKMKIKVFGVVENMSYIKCGNCGEKLKVFSKKSGLEQAESLGIPLLAELPIDLDLVENMENKNIENFINTSSEYDGLLRNFMTLQ